MEVVELLGVGWGLREATEKVEKAFAYWEIWLGFKWGGRWWCGQVPNVGLKPGLKEKGPSRWSKWLPVGSDLPVLLSQDARVSLRSSKTIAVKPFPHRLPQSHLCSFSHSHSQSSNFGYSQNLEAGRRIPVLARWVGWESVHAVHSGEGKPDPGTYASSLCCQVRWREKLTLECVFWKCLFVS